MKEKNELLQKNLKVLRNLTGKTQKEVGKEIHIGRSTISNYELGKRVPPLEMLHTLANYYGVSVGYLLTNENSNAEEILNMNMLNLKFLIKGRFLDTSPLPEEFKNELLEYYRYLLGRAIAENKQKPAKKA